MLYYKIDVLAELKARGYNQTVLHDQQIISQSTVQALRQKSIVGAKSLNALCGMLDMQPGDIIGYTPEGEEVPPPPVRMTKDEIAKRELRDTIREIVKEVLKEGDL